MACVNILPEIRSIYRRQGETRDEAETLLMANYLDCVLNETGSE